MAEDETQVYHQTPGRDKPAVPKSGLLKLILRKLEYGPETTYAGFPSPQAVGVGEQSHSNFLASTVIWPGSYSLVTGKPKGRRSCIRT